MWVDGLMWVGGEWKCVLMGFGDCMVSMEREGKQARRTVRWLWVKLRAEAGMTPEGAIWQRWFTAKNCGQKQTQEHGSSHSFLSAAALLTS